MFGDWITPLVSLLMSSGKDRFAVGDYAAAEQVLKQNGIRCHLPGQTDGLWVFDVDAGQGKKAEKILREAELL